MAVAATPHRAVAHGPRSPTLSDAGMILPAVFAVDYSARSDSPVLYHQRPPSLSALYAASPAPMAAPSLDRHTRLAPLSTRSSRSTLRSMGGSRASMREDTLASSPTIEDALASQGQTPYDAWPVHPHRRLSSASSSVHSDDLDNWPGFDSHPAFTDAPADYLPDHHRCPSSPESDMGDERWPHERSSGSDEDDGPYSSAALSKRAEIILANAKKRLNVMEGNLRGARESLVVSPTFSASSNPMDIAQHISVTRERDRRLYSGIGPIPPRTHSSRTSYLSTTSSASTSNRNSIINTNTNTTRTSTNNSTSSAHSRGLSETAVPLPFKPSYLSKNSSNKRASSAIGHTSASWSQEGYKQRRFPIKESRSHEVLREPRPTLSANTNREVAATSTSRASKRSPSALETLPEDEDRAMFPRSASAASDLRDHVNDLKGRISSLKLKAQEDHLRRRSLQSLRTPSPFTSAQSWQSGPYADLSAMSPFTANTGLGITTDHPARATLGSSDHYSRSRASTLTPSQRAGEELVINQAEEPSPSTHGHGKGHVYSKPHTPNSAQTATLPQTLENDGEAAETDEEDFLSADEEDAGPTGDSVYEDAVYQQTPTERHEDRIDAFDYEHFFLHSAMGSYSMNSRRLSTSSGSSNATTRPVPAIHATDEAGEAGEAGKRMSFHARNPSSDSLSTLASFATAAEEPHDRNEEEANEQMDQFSQQLLSRRNVHASRAGVPTGLSALRTDSAINMRRGAGSSPTLTAVSRGSSSSTPTPTTDVAHGLQTSKIFSLLTERSRGEAQLALSEEDTQLMYRLAASLTSACFHLHSTHEEAYGRSVWRRRLDEACRVLNGDEAV